jgi:nicotinate-nucleotide adenylyltransferase
MTSPGPIAILGGTFDPVHNAHLRVAWEVAEAFDAEVRLLPAHVPPHRPPPVANATQRVALLRTALAGQARLQLDERELQRASPSYTVDTLREFRAEFGASRSLILLLGADAFAGLPTWHEWRALFDLAHIAVLTRPGHTAALSAELENEIAPRRVPDIRTLHDSPHGKLLAFAVTPLEISASMVRALLAAGREPRWLIPGVLFKDPGLLAPYRPCIQPSAVHRQP